MASNQKTPQQKRPKTTHNCFLACFGFHPKTNTSTNNTNNNNNNNSTYKKKASNNNKYGVIRKKFFFKLCLPKFKVLTIDSKNYKKKKKKEIAIKFDAKTGAFKASHNMMLEAATKVHQQFMIDHHHHHHAPKSSITKQEPMTILKDSPHQDNNNQSHRRSKSQSNCKTCNNSQENGTPKGGMVKQSPLSNKITKDSLIGVLIMVAMLIIMSIWGRLCAILCMCGLLYCIPLIKGGNKTQVGTSNPNDNNDTTKDTKIMSVDFNSELYKKKVVLDGLLQRDHQDAVGIS